MIKNKFLLICILIIIFINFSFSISYGIDVPEKDINLVIKNLTRGSEVYMLLPEDLVRYNMQKFIDNNIENVYLVEKEKAQKIQDFLNKNDYIGYLEYLIEQGFECEDNEIEIRHYCFCIGKSEIIDYMEYEGVKYIQIKINLNYNNEFKLIMKDYLTDYDASNIKFMIDEYGSISYIHLAPAEFKVNPDKPYITEYNLIHTFYNNEDYGEIERATDLAYIIIWIILIIIGVVIFKNIEVKRKAKKKEIEARKFWKKKLTKEEIKAAQEHAKNEKKEKNKKLK